MVFDKLCAVVERLRPTDPGAVAMRSILNRCRLFVLGVPSNQMGVDLGVATAEDAQHWEEDFFLPFQVVGLEDHGGLVLFEDRERGQRGAKVPRRYFDVYALDEATLRDTRETGNDEDFGELERLFRERPELKGTLVMSCGTIGSFDIVPDTEYRIRVLTSDVGMTAIAPDGRTYNVESRGPGDPVLQTAVRNIATALSEIMYVNTPGRFVFQKTPIKHDQYEKKARKAGRVLRSHHRPTYTLLRPAEIREILGTGEERGSQKHNSPAPHDRRRHFRRLTSERYVNKKGQRILIPECWVGPREAEHGGHRYKVLVDI